MDFLTIIFTRYFSLVIFFFCVSPDGIAQQQPVKKGIENKRIIKAHYAEGKFLIDGELDESAWAKAPVANQFTENSPQPNTPASFKTEVKILYATDAIYIGAKMYDPAPDSILRQLSVRDDIRSANTDHFTVYIDGMYTQQSAFSFTVTAAGVQGDQSNGDPVWDAAWSSAVQITADGWIAEMEIPYSQLRFPNAKIQQWGINFRRAIRRYRESSFWAKIDPEVDGEVQQYGVLLGIDHIEPPIRLSFTPYAATYLRVEDDGNALTPNVRPYATAGTDLKYGINESFTLDVSLIPDFGDVQFDNLQFNLSPFEIYYAERRPFFTEGTEIFNRAGLFYSRRVGNRPSRSGVVARSIDSSEALIRNPDRTQLINALKISGRSKKGLGVGVFNAVTAPANARIENLNSEEIRKVQTEPLSNYNVVVIDQQFRNNSYLSFTNSTTLRLGEFTDAWVTGTEFRATDLNNKYALSGDAAYSHRFLDSVLYTKKFENGYKANLNIDKVGGKLRYGAGHSIFSKDYNVNDLGFVVRTNYMRSTAYVNYNIFDPFWVYNNMNITLSAYTEQLYRPSKFMRMEVNGRLFGTFKNFLTTGLDFAYQPFGYDDYFESRVGQVWHKPVWSRIGTFFSSDYRKVFALDGRFSYRLFQGESWEWQGSEVVEGNLSPRIRFSDRLNMVLSQNTALRRNNIGFVTFATTVNEEQEIIFGSRYLQTLESRITLNYLFNELMSLSFSARHYWASVEYNRFFELLEDGSLGYTTYDGEHNRNYNAFNVDLIWRWRFAPGSELNIVWKNIVLSTVDELEYDYFRNFAGMFDNNQLNQFSIKLLYFLDVYKLQPADKRGRRTQ